MDFSYRWLISIVETQTSDSLPDLGSKELVELDADLRSRDVKPLCPLRIKIRSPL